MKRWGEKGLCSAWQKEKVLTKMGPNKEGVSKKLAQPSNAPLIVKRKGPPPGGKRE